MDHGLESHVDRAAADKRRYVASVVRLEDRDLDALVGEEAFAESEEDRRVVRDGLPTNTS